MEEIVKGDVVVLPFPFSDLTDYKKRPALVLALLEGDDVVLCQITSQARFDQYSIHLNYNDFKHGKLPVPSRIRPNRLFTGDNSIILYKIGSLKETKFNEVIEKIIRILRS